MRDTQKFVNEFCVSRFVSSAFLLHQCEMERSHERTIGEAVRQVRRARKLTLADVADQIDGYDTGGLSRFERGEQGVSEEKLRQIAVVLEVPLTVLYAIAEFEWDFDLKSSERLLRDEAFKFIPQDMKWLYNAPRIHTRVPLISWVRAGTWADIEDPSTVAVDDVEEWRETTAIVSDRAFALRVVGDSMANPYGAPSIPEGSVVIVDPEKPADNGSIVVAMLDDSNQATIKRLVIDGPNKYLKPLNPAYRTIEINGNCSVVGVVKKVEIDL